MGVIRFANGCKRILLVILALMLCLPASIWNSSSNSVSAAEPNKATTNLPSSEPYYLDVLSKWEKEGITGANSGVVVDALRPNAKSEKANVSIGSYEGKSNVLLWKDSSQDWIEYNVDVPANGLYEIHVSYRPITGESRRSILWRVTIDGDLQYRESGAVVLNRLFKDALSNNKDANGDEIRPKIDEVNEWTIKPLVDASGAYATPLRWNFTKGSHKLRFTGNEDIAIESIRLAPVTSVSTYADVLKAYPKQESSQAEMIQIEAEAASAKNDSSIQLVSDNDVKTSPAANGKIVYNSIGGKRWANANQELIWKFDVPVSGRYMISMRTLQKFVSQKASFRTISIDGKVPFKEMLTYRFPYDTDWKGSVLGTNDGDGEPYLFYLEKGSHTLSMTVTHEPFKPVMLGFEELSNLLMGIDEDLLALTGGTEDLNRTWKIAQDLPDLPGRLNQARDKMVKLAQEMEKVNGRKDNVSQGLMTSVKDIDALLKKIDDVPYKRSTISSMRNRFTTFSQTLIEQPMQIDQIYIVPEQAGLPELEASWFAKVKGAVVNFFYSFRSKKKLSDLEEDALNVWVFRGRDYVNLLQEFANEMYTPKTGIKVKVNLLPTTQLLVLSNAAGKQPDVVLGLGQDLPIDYAIRGSLTDLSKFPDFQQVYKQFAPGAWLSYYYNNGYYAVPETQNFQVMYYRKDIMEQLGLKIPDTWDDVKQMLPTLQQNKMNFYYTPNDYLTLFYQNGADMLTQDGTKTATDSPEAFKSFKEWMDLFNIYGVSREVPSFYQHFRAGTIPIGITNYNLYIQMLTAAPELNGWWGVAPLPGVKQPDGTVARWTGGGQNAGIIFKSSKKQEQAWDFMKWWVSADVQERYGKELEAFNGTAFRWNTANIDAFVRLPWEGNDAKTILEQWKWYKEMPHVPGSYFFSREMNNAWNRAVVDGMNFRTSLEIANDNINRELLRKQQEFGFIDENGQVVKSLNLPVINKPWDGVNKYVGP